MHEGLVLLGVWDCSTKLLKLKHKTVRQSQEPDSIKIEADGIKIPGVETSHFLRELALETKTQEREMLKHQSREENLSQVNVKIGSLRQGMSSREMWEPALPSKKSGNQHEKRTGGILCKTAHSCTAKPAIPR